MTQNCVASVTYNPISTRWADYDHHSTTSPPEFSDLTTALISTVQGCHRESKLGKTNISQWCSAAAASSLENFVRSRSHQFYSIWHPCKLATVNGVKVCRPVLKIRCNLDFIGQIRNRLIFLKVQSLMSYHLELDIFVFFRIHIQDDILCLLV